MLKLIYLMMFLYLSNIIYSQEVINSKQVEIQGTQELNIKSTITEKDYKLYINLPRNINDPGKTFPVIYLLDAQWDFTLLQAIYGEQYYDGFLPDAIIVGITWGGENPNPDSLRVIDFTPSKTKQEPTGGGAKKFLEFIKNELIPFIESKYKTSPNDRTLIGCSLGGLFTLYAMLNEPNLFSKYVLTSPALQWDKNIIYSYLNQYSEKNKNLKAKLFMGIGEYEQADNFQKFSNLLEEKKFADLKFKAKVIMGAGHSGGKAEGFTRGLQFAFEKTPIQLNGNNLSNYIGDYRSTDEDTISIEAKNKNLTAHSVQLGSVNLHAETENDFYSIGQFLLLHFKRNEEGKIIGFQLEKYADKTDFKKLD